MTSNCTIPANPDIAGIGVRVALYAQALLTLLPSCLALWASTPVLAPGQVLKSDTRLNLESKILYDLGPNSIVSLLTGTALLISALLQARLSGIDVYHALIVFNLSWLNNVTPIVVDLLKLTVDGNGRHWDLGWTSTVHVFHFIFTGAFGIWLFKDIDNFGLQPQCNSETQYFVFGFSIPATAPAFRVLGLVISSIAVVPLLNLLALMFGIFGAGCSLWFIVYFWAYIFSSPSIADRPGAIGVANFICTFLLIALFIIGTEGTVMANKSLVQSGENDWTFGQTLALLVLAMPVLDVISKARESIGIRRRGKQAPLQEDVPMQNMMPSAMVSAKDGDGLRYRKSFSDEETEQHLDIAFLGMLG